VAVRGVKVKVESRKNNTASSRRVCTRINHAFYVTHRRRVTRQSRAFTVHLSSFVLSLSLARVDRSSSGRARGSDASVSRPRGAAAACACVQRRDRTNGDLSEMRVLTLHLVTNASVRLNGEILVVRRHVSCELRRRTTRTRTTRTKTTTRHSHATATRQSRVRRVNLI